MEIIISEQGGYKTDVFLMDGEKIADYKIDLQSHLVKDFVTNLSIRYDLPKNCMIKFGLGEITLHEYFK